MRFVIWCAIGCCSLFACNKDNPSRKNEFIECTVDGIHWKSGSVHDQMEWSDSGRYFNLSGYDEDQNSNLSISVYDPKTELQSGTYQLNAVNVAGYNDQDISFMYRHKTDTVNTGTITILFDDANNRISGSFSFKAKYETNNDIITVTNGRFSMLEQKQ